MSNLPPPQFTRLKWAFCDVVFHIDFAISFESIFDLNFASKNAPGFGRKF